MRLRIDDSERESHVCGKKYTDSNVAWSGLFIGTFHNIMYLNHDGSKLQHRVRAQYALMSSLMRMASQPNQSPRLCVPI